MRRTTLVTLKARSQAFRMAMGILHEGKTPAVHQYRCQWCGTLFEVSDDAAAGDWVCPVCAKRLEDVEVGEWSASLLPHRCDSCGKEFTGAIPRCLCPECFERLRGVKGEVYRPRTRAETFKRLAAVGLFALMCTFFLLFVIVIFDAFLISQSRHHSTTMSSSK